MRNVYLPCAVCALLSVAIGCNQPTDTHDADVQAIKANEVQWNQDFAAKDADRLASHYADDATLMMAGGPATAGKDAIHAAFKQMVADPALVLKFQASRVDVAKSGELGYTQGTYTMTMTNPQTKQPMDDHGSYLTVYHKQAEGWKAVQDVVTSEVPMPPATPAPAPVAAKGKK